MTSKDRVRYLLDRLPDTASLDEIQYHIGVLRSIERGMHEIAEGKSISHEEIVERMAKWLSPSMGREK